jgi:hypothetical protein
MTRWSNGRGCVAVRAYLASLGALALCAVACDARQPIAPSPPLVASPVPTTPSAPTISGNVWLHTADGVRPFANQSVFGWINSGSSGRTTGRVPTDSNGRFSFPAPLGSRVRIHIGGFGYQPCEVNANVAGDVTRDIHAVDDRLQLGGRLPAELLANTPTISGYVFEINEDGRHRLADVRVELDGLFGLGLVTATTLTDADGRYVLCGLEGESSTYLFASKAGYQLYEKTVGVNGDTTLDIELRR